ncbi:hypothetical protein KX729_17165 [Rhizobium sp. XQZ8]|uniref:hypothetical protein n=1 Tax=Rhizobium populisoli TaxID=2859785 RepID=UPI001CA55B8D|nr:hypothetical protein [Rhizobium populisoli]MBW6423190.1 hypothetical protein [Rhizobium populisoli]
MAGIDLQPADKAVFGRLKSTGHITHSLRRVMTQQWNRCCVCGKAVTHNRPAFAGYDTSGIPLLVGAECADRLSELATPVYWTGKLDLSVPDRQFVWRYMDFGKFVTMLKQRGLFVPAADTFEDRFEGAIGLANRQVAWDQFYLDFFRQAVTTLPPGVPPQVKSEDEIEVECKRLLNDFKSDSRNIRKTLVSCWHANDGESEALWRLYCPPSTLGIAIKTTAEHLWSIGAARPDVLVGRVHYVDFAKAFASNDIERIFCKRASLRHENEVRLVLSNDRKHPTPGALIPYDLNLLIQQVVVSPFAPSWFSETVSDVIGKYGMGFNVRSSELADEPFY